LVAIADSYQPGMLPDLGDYKQKTQMLRSQRRMLNCATRSAGITYGLPVIEEFGRQRRAERAIRRDGDCTPKWITSGFDDNTLRGFSGFVERLGR